MQRARLHGKSGLKVRTADLCRLFFQLAHCVPENTQPRRGHSAACRHRPPHVSLVTLIASHVLQHVQLSRPHNSFPARFSLFLPYSNSARLFRLLCPASAAMDLQRMVAENQNNPAFLQEIIRMLAQTQSDVGSVHPEDASNAPGPSNTDLLDFSDPHVAPAPEHASATVEPKCKAKPASLLRPDPPELPEDCIPAHAPEGKEAVPLEPAPAENSMPEPPQVRAPWAQLTEEEQEEQLAREEPA